MPMKKKKNKIKTLAISFALLINQSLYYVRKIFFLNFWLFQRKYNWREKAMQS